MRIGAWVGAILWGTLALGCGAPPEATEPGASPAGGGTTSPGGGTVGTHEGAMVQVELRGLESLSFADSTRIALERFVVSLGEVSLIRDLADPLASRLDLAGRQLPIIGRPGEPIVDRFIIGRETLQNGGFKGIRLELSPPAVPTTSPDDGGSTTIFLRAVYTMPAFLDFKGDGAKISPNPAPIEPYASAAQAVTSVYRLSFSFRSRKVEDLLVGLASELGAGKTLVLVFRANYWFTEDVRAYLAAEVTRRIRLGIPSSLELVLVGEGYPTTDEAQAAIGSTLESNILDTIGIEVR